MKSRTTLCYGHTGAKVTSPKVSTRSGVHCNVFGIDQPLGGNLENSPTCHVGGLRLVSRFAFLSGLGDQAFIPVNMAYAESAAPAAAYRLSL